MHVLGSRRICMNYLSMEDISKKPIRIFESRASGIMIISKSNFTHFMQSTQKDIILQTAITVGINATKKTSEIFPLCYQVLFDSIDITITPHDSIQTPYFVHHENFIPSFKPKKFSFHTVHDEIKTPNAHVSADTSRFGQEWINTQKEKLQYAKQKFVKMQQSKIQHTGTHKESDMYGKCGFCVSACIKSHSKIKANMESLNAVSATLLGLFNILKTQDKGMVITEIRLDD